MKKSQNMLVWLTKMVSAAQYMTLCKFKLDEEKSKQVGLAHQNGYGCSICDPAY